MTWFRSQWDRLLAVAALVAGAVVLLLGWFGVSGSPYPAAQLPYLISAGVGGLFLLGVSTALWLSADLHDEWRKLDRLEQAIRESGAADVPPDVATNGAGRPPSVPERDPERTSLVPAVVYEGTS